LRITLKQLILIPNYAKAYYDRAVVRSTIGDKQRAIKDFEKAAVLFRQQGDLDNYRQAVNRIGRFDIVAG
jgi:Tfp pilus assembly protein PilF